MPENNHFSDWKKFPAVEDAYPNIRDYILESAKNCGVNLKKILKLELGVEEIVINVIHYAYKDGGDILVKVIDDAENHHFILELIDFGTPFNPLKKIDQRSIDKSAIEKRKIGGFGIAFTKKIFAALNYSFEKFEGKEANHLTLVFNKD